MTKYFSLLVRLKSHLYVSFKLLIFWQLPLDLWLNLIQNAWKIVWKNYSMKFKLIFVLFVCQRYLSLIKCLTLIVCAIDKRWGGDDLNGRLNGWRHIVSDLFFDELCHEVHKHVVYLRHLFVSECEQLCFIACDQVKQSCVLGLVGKQSLYVFFNEVIIYLLFLQLLFKLLLPSFLFLLLLFLLIVIYVLHEFLNTLFVDDGYQVFAWIQYACRLVFIVSHE